MNNGAAFGPRRHESPISCLSSRSFQSLDVGRSYNGDVNVAFYDTRNDTGPAPAIRTDYYLARSTDGGVTFPGPDIRVSTVSSNEHDCNGLFPCQAINYGNQQG